MHRLSERLPSKVIDAATVRPFLKWAGGKRQLLPVLRRFYPARFRGYHEPFLGSGAVFFDLVNQGRLPAERVRLTDMNADLIGCCLRLRDQTNEVVAALRRLDDARRRDPDAHYYRVRDEMFNPARAAILNGARPRPDRYTPELAAMLIYLNRTGYNGLFRLNAKGAFNVPRGRYVNPRVCDEDNLRAVASAFEAVHATIDYSPYDALVQHAQAEDFIYLDPPYAPLSRTAHFTSYTAGGFSSADQRRLQQVVLELADRGCFVLLSNSTAAEIGRLYDGNRDAARAGIRAHRVLARRAINSNTTGRSGVMEYVITNIAA
ncbi:MAG: Dam family site-specific DNA-(adenine-N6)-methyltransferase [Acidobacteria bacterium]|nr:Dam family site-specific DNA-(adenine-N6)-methyltransferase [Acidobacteriota bacterium]